LSIFAPNTILKSLSSARERTDSILSILQDEYALKIIPECIKDLLNLPIVSLKIIDFNHIRSGGLFSARRNLHI